MEEKNVPITIVNHVAIDIATEPDLIWASVLEEYLHGEKFRRAGYTVTPMEYDPAAFLGGYHMAIGPDLQDERLCRVTERDASAMRLSLRADYLASAANGMHVHATYGVQAMECGARYTIDSYATFDLAEAGAGGNLADAVSVLTGQFDAALSSYLAERNLILEQLGVDGRTNGGPAHEASLP